MHYGPFRLTRKTLTEYLPLGFLHVFIFLLVYGYTNYHASQLPPSELLSAYHPLELKVPFVPQWFIVYSSIGLMMMMPLIFVPRHRLGPYITAQISATLLAGLVFYFFPFRCGFERIIPDEGAWRTALALFYSMDKPHNLVPSLHITYSTIILLFVREHAQGRWYISLHIWALAIYASVLLTHQHHLIDIASGALLSIAVYRLSEYLPESWGPLFAAPQDEIYQESPP